MTDENMDLRALLEKTGDTGFLREMIGFTAQRLMELEVENLTGHDECKANRGGRPNSDTAISGISA